MRTQPVCTAHPSVLQPLTQTRPFAAVVDVVVAAAYVDAARPRPGAAAAVANRRAGAGRLVGWDLHFPPNSASTRIPLRTLRLAAAAAAAAGAVPLEALQPRVVEPAGGRRLQSER